MSAANVITTPYRPRSICRSIVRKWKILFLFLLLGIIGSSIAGAVWFRQRYAVVPVMDVFLREYSTAEYPEDPADRSAYFGQYKGRTLKLVAGDETHFDFIFESPHKHVATVVFRNVDVALMTPSLPEWCKTDDGLERIALTDRQWNRQQVRFEVNSPLVEVTGGDGFEKDRLYSAELAKNCLNAGLWEVLLFVKENDRKTLYYQGWFTFPLGQYARIFEKNTGLAYRKHWYKLEHWSDPHGIPFAIDTLREVKSEKTVESRFDPDERLLASGEQVRKRRTTDAANVLAWKDFYDGHPVTFAAFVPPGRYDVHRPWKNQYWRLANFEDAVLREVQSPASAKPLQEIELRFRSQDRQEVARLVVSGIRIDELPQLPVARYSEGLYMPMGIGVPPFFQTYSDLQEHIPSESGYFSVLLDDKNHWLNHHDIAVDGPVLHRDEHDPLLVHLYILSYERHSLIGHWILSVGTQTHADLDR